MFSKNDARLSVNLGFLKAITVIICILLALGSIGAGVLLMLEPGEDMLIIGISVAAGGAVVSFLTMFIILAILNVKASIACDVKLIRNKLYGNHNGALVKFIGYEANDEVVSAADAIVGAISALTESVGTPAAPITAPITAPAPMTVPAPMAAPAPKPATRKPAVKKPAGKPRPAVDTSGVDPAEVARLDALLEKGTITADMYKQLVNSKKRK